MDLEARASATSSSPFTSHPSASTLVNPCGAHPATDDGAVLVGVARRRAMAEPRSLARFSPRPQPQPARLWSGGRGPAGKPRARSGAGARMRARGGRAGRWEAGGRADGRGWGVCRAMAERGGAATAIRQCLRSMSRYGAWLGLREPFPRPACRYGTAHRVV